MKTEFYDEIKLLHLLKAGDSDAYFQLYNKYHPALYAYILRFIKIPELAEDVSVYPDQMIPVEVKSSSVVFFNGYTLHSSLRNKTTDCFRTALVNHYMSTESMLPWDAFGQKVSKAGYDGFEVGIACAATEAELSEIWNTAEKYKLKIIVQHYSDNAAPICNQWDVNVYMMELLKKRYN